MKIFLFFSDFGQKHLRISFDVEKQGIVYKEGTQEIKYSRMRRCEILDADS